MHRIMLIYISICYIKLGIDTILLTHLPRFWSFKAAVHQTEFSAGNEIFSVFPYQFYLIEQDKENKKFSALNMIPSCVLK